MSPAREVPASVRTDGRPHIYKPVAAARQARPSVRGAAAPHEKQPYWTRSPYLVVCTGLWLAYIVLMILNAAGVITVPPEQDNVQGIFGRLWTWTDDPVLQGIIQIVLVAITIYLIPGLLITGLGIAAVLVVATIGVAVAGVFIVLYGLVIHLLWKASPAGKVIAVLIVIATACGIRWLVVEFADNLMELFARVAAPVYKFDFAGRRDPRRAKQEEKKVMHNVKKTRERYELAVGERQYRVSEIADVPLPVEPTTWREHVRERFRAREQTRTLATKTTLLTRLKEYYTEYRAALVAQHELQGTNAFFGEQDEEAALRGMEREKKKLTLKKDIAKLRRREKPLVLSSVPVVSSIERIARMRDKRAAAHDVYADDAELQAISDRQWDDRIMRAMEEMD